MSKPDDSFHRKLERILTLDFSPAEHARYSVLASKAQEGTLTPDERAEIDAFLELNALLCVLQSKARAILKKRDPS